MAVARRTLVLVGALLVLTLETCASVAHAQRMSEGEIRALGVRTPSHFRFEDMGLTIVWSYDLPDTGARALRLHFASIVDRSVADYRVLVFDRHARLVAEYSKQRFAARSDFWTGFIMGGGLRVEIRAASIPDGLGFTLAQYATRVDRPRLESIFGDPDWKFIHTKADDRGILQAARAVAKLAFIREGKPDSCTGFLVGTDRLVTNDHCVSSPDVCETAVAVFGYERRPDGTEGWEHEARCVEVLRVDQAHDFAMLRVEGAPGRQYGTLVFVNRLPQKNERLYLVQHPGGEPKMLSEIDCIVKTARAPGIVDDADFGHTCDTAWGSSGSPVLDRNLGVIGLHHTGFITTESRWRSENRAVRSDRILREVRP